MATLVVCGRCGRDNRVDETRARSGTPVCGQCKSELNVRAPGHPIHTTDSAFEEDVLQSGVPTLVDFWADWCGPCRTLEPTLEQLARELAGQVRVVKVNTDQCPQMARRYGIRSIPTLIVFKGSEVNRVSGALPLADLRRFVRTHL